ncbi:MAG TPA: L-threonylcarbamoyladenylate synthase [Dehalococcoidia bacterium]|nr:L-threonylcarbamoyladenylate synthase [Dehalococcoidia bacterium]
MLVIKADSAKVIERAARVLRADGLVCYPTDTVYGLGAIASNDGAVRRLYAVKGRPLEKALPILLADAEQVEELAQDIPEQARRLMQRLWPGGLTIVLKKSGQFRSLALGEEETVAVRVPNQPLVRELIRRIGAPLTGTSANRSGQRPPVTAEEVAQQLNGDVDMIIDGGQCPGGIESTVVDLTQGQPQILREGAVPAAEIEALTGKASG